MDIRLQLIQMIYEQKIKGKLSQRSINKLHALKDLTMTQEEWNLAKILIGYTNDKRNI